MSRCPCTPRPEKTEQAKSNEWCSQYICTECESNRLRAKHVHRQSLQQRLIQLKNMIRLKFQSDGILDKLLPKRLYIKAKKQRLCSLKNRVAQLRQQLGQEQSTGECLRKFHKQEYSQCCEKQLQTQQKQNQMNPSSKNLESDPTFLYLKALTKNNLKMQQMLSVQRKDKLSILTRVLDIYKFEWKKYFIKRHFKLKGNEDLFFISQMQEKENPVLEARQFTRIVCNQQTELRGNNDFGRMLQVLIQNSMFIILFHRIFCQELSLPYKMFANKGTVYLGNYYLSRGRLRPELNAKYIEDYVGCLQANLLYIAKAIGQTQQPFILLQNSLLTKYAENQCKIIGISGKEKINYEYLHELKLDEILRKRSSELAGQNERIPMMNNWHLPQHMERGNSLDSDEDFQVLE